MTKETYHSILAELKTLPVGGITYKNINGKKYVYYQWREGESSMPDGQREKNCRLLQNRLQTGKSENVPLNSESIYTAIPMTGYIFYMVCAEQEKLR